MELFGKKEIASLGAIKDVAADKITPDQVAAINAEFAALGFGGIEVAIAGTIEPLKASVTAHEVTIAAHVATIASNDATIAEHVASDEANTSRIAALEAEVITLGGQAAAKPSVAGAAEDVIETEAKADPNKYAADLSAKILAEKLGQ